MRSLTPGIIFGAILVAYPLVVYLGLLYFDARSVALLLVLLAGGRWLFAKRDEAARAFPPQLLFALVATVVIALLVLISDSDLYLRLYPVAINALMLVLFGLSLWQPPTMIERFARLKEPDLPEGAVRYTRNVTIVWCLFFIINGSIALYTAIATSLEIWTIYNGSIAYGLMGALFAGEYLVRRRFQKKKLA